MKSLPLVLLVPLAACSSQSSQPAPSPTENATAMASAAAAGPAVPIPDVFSQCSVCHTSGQGGPNAIGPNLFGVYGKKAGTNHPDFAYSDPLKASGLIWDDATLDKWLTKPQALVPGTKMTFAGLTDPAQRQAAIAYLKSLK